MAAALTLAAVFDRETIHFRTDLETATQNGPFEPLVPLLDLDKKSMQRRGSDDSMPADVHGPEPPQSGSKPDKAGKHARRTDTTMGIRGVHQKRQRRHNRRDVHQKRHDRRSRRRRRHVAGKVEPNALLEWEDSGFRFLETLL
jgi:hypothetical protein